MTSLRKLTLLILIVIIIFLTLLYYKKYIVLAFLILSIIFLSYKWYILLTEEFIVYQLLKEGEKIDYDKLVKMFGKKVKIALKSLKKKEIIEYDYKIVILKIKDYQFSLKQMGRVKKAP